MKGTKNAAQDGLSIMHTNVTTADFGFVKIARRFILERPGLSLSLISRPNARGKQCHDEI